MTGLLICAAVVAFAGFGLALGLFVSAMVAGDVAVMVVTAPGLALIAAALYLAWRAGGTGA